MLCTGKDSCQELHVSMYIRSLLQQALCVLLAGGENKDFCGEISDSQGIYFFRKEFGCCVVCALATLPSAFIFT